MILRMLNLSKNTCLQPIEIASTEANRFFALRQSDIAKKTDHSRYLKIKNKISKLSATNGGKIKNAKEIIFKKFSDLK
jgi:hypothetical protein